MEKRLGGVFDGLMVTAGFSSAVYVWLTRCKACLGPSVAVGSVKLFGDRLKIYASRVKNMAKLTRLGRQDGGLYLETEVITLRMQRSS